jgi:hypothetical protein
MSLKNPVTPPGIDPGTVRLVAQRLHHYATPGPMLKEGKIKKRMDKKEGKEEFTTFTFISTHSLPRHYMEVSA